MYIYTYIHTCVCIYIHTDIYTSLVFLIVNSQLYKGMFPKLILVNSAFLSNNNLLSLSPYHVPGTAVDPLSKYIICKSADLM